MLFFMSGACIVLAFVLPRLLGVMRLIPARAR